ncbi:MAG TPA: hypothetical protein VD966_13110 [Pyrinomonadaceae bacterium]|nr:hypothetical protein [Pyrinomonadaceae bacterium]
MIKMIRQSLTGLLELKRGLLIVGFVICLCAASGSTKSVVAQEKPAEPRKTEEPAVPAARPGDVASIDSIIAAVYDVISGPAGKKRDWDRMRSHFVPGARLIPTGPRPAGGYGSRVLSVEDYISSASPFFEKNGFFEREIARRTETFGHIAHAFSTYESRNQSDDPKPFQRGINSIQLMNDGKRWWIVTIFWQGEDKDNPLPEKYLEGQKD